MTHLIKQLSRLPSIGAKSAARIAYYLLQTDPGYTETLAEDIRTIQHRIKPCTVCGAFTEADPCDVCSDHRRDQTRICVVEQPQDVAVLEATGAFGGLYHVLGGVISPIDGVGPEDLSVAKLIDRATGVSEVIIATNPTVEGDTTALYVAKLLEERGIPASRLALGLPVGGDLEYADRLTIERSLRGRTRLTTEF
ncbi:MAG: recombination protein RecR [Spirochaetales bacterium]|nr:MAG: recombination protein RecR [Spirochaetales bacterium]